MRDERARGQRRGGLQATSRGSWLAKKPVDPLPGFALVVGVGAYVNLRVGVIRGARLIVGSAPEAELARRSCDALLAR